jgi:flagellar M-ring protein FliF
MVMAERLKKIGKQLLDLWNKYTSKQKTLIISVACVVILAFALLIFLMNKVDYTKFKVCQNATEASQIKDVLDKDGIKNKFDDKTLTIYVETKKSSDAILLLAKNDISTEDISVDDLLNNSLSTTNADRTLKINLYLQDHLKNKIKKMEGIDDAEVFYIPKDSNTDILTEKEDTSASVLLTVNDDFKNDSAKTIAQVVASVVGNDSAETVKVADQYGHLLYGGNDDLYSGTPSSNADYKERLTNTYSNNLYMGLIKSGYDDVEIMPHLEFNMNKVNELYTEYTPADGQDQGLLSHSYTYKAENAGSSGGGVPGTSSNDGTTYDTTDSSSTNGTTESQENISFGVFFFVAALLLVKQPRAQAFIFPSSNDLIPFEADFPPFSCSV